MSNFVVDSQIEEFRDALQAGVQGFVRCGEIYVAAIDENPMSAEMFQREFAEIVPPSMWANFEAVGRKWLHPKMLMGGVSDRKKNSIFKRLPFSIQERIFGRERFPLLLANGDTLQVDALEATSEQAEQLFDNNGVRSAGAQKAWLESYRTKTTGQQQAETLPYTICNGVVTFRRGTKLTRPELKRLLAEM